MEIDFLQFTVYSLYLYLNLLNVVSLVIGTAGYFNLVLGRLVLYWGQTNTDTFDQCWPLHRSNILLLKLENFLTFGLRLCGFISICIKPGPNPSPESTIVIISSKVTIKDGRCHQRVHLVPFGIIHLNSEKDCGLCFQSQKHA